MKTMENPHVDCAFITMQGGQVTKVEPVQLPPDSMYARLLAIFVAAGFTNLPEYAAPIGATGYLDTFPTPVTHPVMVGTDAVGRPFWVLKIRCLENDDVYPEYWFRRYREGNVWIRGGGSSPGMMEEKDLDDLVKLLAGETVDHWGDHLKLEL